MKIVTLYEISKLISVSILIGNPSYITTRDCAILHLIFLLKYSGRLIGHPYCGIFEGSARALFSICPKMQRGVTEILPKLLLLSIFKQA